MRKPCVCLYYPVPYKCISFLGKWFVVKNKTMMQFSIVDGKVRAEIDIDDLVYLFATHKSNYDGDRPVAFVRGDKRKEFAKALIERLQEQSLGERDCVRWAEPIEDVFDEFLEDDCPFLKYLDLE